MFAICNSKTSQFITHKNANDKPVIMVFMDESHATSYLNELSGPIEHLKVGPVYMSLLPEDPSDLMD